MKRSEMYLAEQLCLHTKHIATLKCQGCGGKLTTSDSLNPKNKLKIKRVQLQCLNKETCGKKPLFHALLNSVDPAGAAKLQNLWDAVKLAQTGLKEQDSIRGEQVAEEGEDNVYTDVADPTPLKCAAKRGRVDTPPSVTTKSDSDAKKWRRVDGDSLAEESQVSEESVEEDKEESEQSEEGMDMDNEEELPFQKCVEVEEEEEKEESVPFNKKERVLQLQAEMLQLQVEMKKKDDIINNLLTTVEAMKEQLTFVTAQVNCIVEDKNSTGAKATQQKKNGGVNVQQAEQKKSGLDFLNATRPKGPERGHIKKDYVENKSEKRQNTNPISSFSSSSSSSNNAPPPPPSSVPRPPMSGSDNASQGEEFVTVTNKKKDKIDNKRLHAMLQPFDAAIADKEVVRIGIHFHVSKGPDGKPRPYKDMNRMADQLLFSARVRFFVKAFSVIGGKKVLECFVLKENEERFKETMLRWEAKTKFYTSSELDSLLSIATESPTEVVEVARKRLVYLLARNTAPNVQKCILEGSKPDDHAALKADATAIRASWYSKVENEEKVECSNV